jgi:REP element-mobilizing transposase RayT
MKYDSDKYHRRSLRLPGYDYTQAGAYFVTVCTRGRACIFGDVVSGEMRLNLYGRIVHECWKALPDHFANIQLDEFIIMPNHVHGIVNIVDRSRSSRRGTACRAPTTVIGIPFQWNVAPLRRNNSAILFLAHYPLSFVHSSLLLPSALTRCVEHRANLSGSATTTNTSFGMSENWMTSGST